MEFCVCGILRLWNFVLWNLALWNFACVEFCVWNLACGILYLWNLGVVPFFSSILAHKCPLARRGERFKKQPEPVDQNEPIHETSLFMLNRVTSYSHFFGVTSPIPFTDLRRIVLKKTK